MKRLLSWIEKIVVSDIRKQIFLYFLEKKVSTIPVVSDHIDVPKSSVYREVKNLVQLGILEQVVRARYIKKIAGRTPGIYGLKGTWGPDDVNLALELHRKLNMPSYVIVKKVSQSIMDEYLSRRIDLEIDYKEIITLCKQSCEGYYHSDISSQVADFLKDKGVKVWR